MRKSRTLRAGLAGALIGVCAGALVYYGISAASIPDPSGTIHGCYQTSGKAHKLKVIDSAVTSSCPSGYTSLDWNQTGPTGPSAPAQPHIYDTQGTGTTSTYQFVDPAGVSSVEVEAWGGGGGGGAGCGDDYEGQPGTSGDYEQGYAPVTPGDSYTVVVGGGGIGGVFTDSGDTADGQDGAGSSLTSASGTVVGADGGTGGYAGCGGTPQPNGTQPGTTSAGYSIDTISGCMGRSAGCGRSDLGAYGVAGDETGGSGGAGLVIVTPIQND